MTKPFETPCLWIKFDKAELQLLISSVAKNIREIERKKKQWVRKYGEEKKYEKGELISSLSDLLQKLKEMHSKFPE